ncbi:phospholipase A [Sulfurimonas sp. SAG-AH-194-C21]|nr:phospholipase A [Sulfurimonas sp. SAG-AH-194-C21]MDF1883655.1 phospholipase A [Sulfurimonas sp. SAG-AH-194-C21]
MKDYLSIVLLFIAVSLYANDVSDDVTCDLDEVKSVKTKSSMQKWLDHDFGLRPYKVNYILPYAFREDAYESNIPSLEYKNIEAELQISLQLQVGNDIFGLGEKYYVSYTQQAFWQIYAESAPIRETTYNPEAFVIFPIEDDDDYFRFRSLKFALAHLSNGQANTKDVVFDNNQALGNLSRSVNYVYTTLRLQHKSIVLDLEAWIPFPEDPEKSDNVDLMDYWGYTSAKVTYFLDEHMFTLKGRGNFGTRKGAVEATYSYPLIHNYFFAKVFSGYGESLIDYDEYITKVSVGFSFSR